MDSLDAFQGTYNERLSAMAKQKRIPISGTFELLPTCNMRCKMCYIQHTPKREELQPKEFWIDLFEQAIAEGMLYPLLTGGEPFLYPEFRELYERLSKMPVYLVINTNATLLDEETVKWLAKTPPRRLNISLYGASDETYARLCGNPNGFSQVMRAFELLKKYDVQFHVHSTMVPDNVGDYRGIIDVCNRHQVQLQMSGYMFPAYRKDLGCATTEGRFSAEELAQFSFMHGRDVGSLDERSYADYVMKRGIAFEHPEVFSLYGKNDVACRGGICTFWVDWRGTISGCGVHQQDPVDLHTTSFKDAWKQVIERTDCIRISEKCKTCKYRCLCPVCPAASFCETGSMTGTPEYLCAYCEAYAKLLLEERERLFGKQG